MIIKRRPLAVSVSINVFKFDRKLVSIASGTISEPPTDITMVSFISIASIVLQKRLLLNKIGWVEKVKTFEEHISHTLRCRQYLIEHFVTADARNMLLKEMFRDNT